MRVILRRLLLRARQEQGFTMVTVLGAMTGIMLLSIAAISVAQGDLGSSAADTETKQAYQAAEAGVNEYAYHLTQDNNYWAKCDGVPTPAPVNQPFLTGASTTTAKDAKAVKWRSIPGSTSSYAIEVLPKDWTPATASTKFCNTADATGSMIDSSTGTFRIRSTGRTPTRSGYRYRTIVTTFRKKGFLDFLYFTYYETKDPTLYTLDTGGQEGPTKDVVDWATKNCGVTYWRDGRGNMSFNYKLNGEDRTARCTEIQFVDADAINGPLHTNDSLLICGTPDFGRTKADNIETEAAEGWRANGNCGTSAPNFKGTYRPSAGHLELPKRNTSIKNNTDTAYQYTGTTTLELQGANNKMKVVNTTMGINATVDVPANGVINVADGNCGATYDPLNTGGGTADTAAVPAGCGNVYVKGSYSKDLTIAADSDIIVNGNITRTNDSVLGLIANQFVRVAHPVTNLNKSTLACDTPSSASQYRDIKIEAGILALNHSFIVDNYYCGGTLGTLTIDGVIAQRYRGPVGTGNGSTAVTGYIKNYKYDDRLSLRQPPFFLSPVESSWRVARQIEQTGR